MRIGKTTVLHFVSQIVVTVAGFLATFLIARLLGPEPLGKYAVAVAVGFYWLRVPGNAVSFAMNKRVSEGGDRSASLSAGFLLNGFVILVLVSIMLALDEVFNSYFRADISIYVAFLTAAAVFFTTVTSGLNGQKKVGHSGGIKAFERSARTISQVVFIIVGFGVIGLIVGHITSLLVAALIGLALYDVGFEMPSKKHIKSNLSYAKYSWLEGLKSRTFGWMDTLILAIFVSPSLIGVYEVAWGLGSMMAVASTSIRSALFPEISELDSKEDSEQITHYLNEGLVYTGIFVVPGFFGAAILGEDVLRIYRPEFAQGYGVLIILVAAYICHVYGIQLINTINAVNRPDIAFRVNLVFVLGNILLNFALIYLIGWYGAAFATLFSSLAWLMLGYVSVNRLIEVKVPVREIAFQITSSAAMAAVVLAAKTVLPRGHFVTITLVFLGGCTYVGVLLLLSERVRDKSTALLRESGVMD